MALVYKEPIATLYAEPVLPHHHQVQYITPDEEVLLST